jgi:hypothetical protein
MSKKKRRKKRDAISIEEAIGNSVDQGLLRSVAAMGQQVMERVLKTDSKIKSLVEQLVKARLERMLRDLGDKEK